MLSVVVILAGIAAVFMGITGRYKEFWTVVKTGLQG